jgi:hypothetical protein
VTVVDDVATPPVCCFDTFSFDISSVGWQRVSATQDAENERSHRDLGFRLGFRHLQPRVTFLTNRLNANLAARRRFVGVFVCTLGFLVGLLRRLFARAFFFLFLQQQTQFERYRSRGYVPWSTFQLLNMQQVNPRAILRKARAAARAHKISTIKWVKHRRIMLVAAVAAAAAAVALATTRTTKMAIRRRNDTSRRQRHFAPAKSRNMAARQQRIACLPVRVSFDGRTLQTLKLVTPHVKCKLRLLKLERVKDWILLEEEYIQNMARLRPQEEKAQVCCSIAC